MLSNGIEEEPLDPAFMQYNLSKPRDTWDNIRYSIGSPDDARLVWVLQDR